MSNKTSRRRRHHLSYVHSHPFVVSVSELGGSSSSKLPWNSPGLQGAGASHGLLCGYTRGGRCRETDKVATWYSMFCRPAAHYPPSGRSSALTAVRRPATGGPVLRQRAVAARVNKT